MLTMMKNLAMTTLALHDPAATAAGRENHVALTGHHTAAADTITYAKLPHAEPQPQTGPRRRLRQASTAAKAPAPAPALINESTVHAHAPMTAPAPQSMTRLPVPGLVTKTKPFSVIDAGGNKWKLPAGDYLKGKDAEACCSTTYAPYKEQIEVHKQDCCGVGAFSSTKILSPGNSNNDLPAKCCGCGN